MTITAPARAVEPETRPRRHSGVQDPLGDGGLPGVDVSEDAQITDAGQRAGGVGEVGEPSELGESLLSDLIDRFNAKFGTEFTEEDVLPAFNAAKNDPKVRAATVVNDEDNFGVVFDKAFNGYMMDHVSTIDTLGERYFGPDRDFKSNLDRSARRAAWRMIRSEEGLDDV